MRVLLSRVRELPRFRLFSARSAKQPVTCESPGTTLASRSTHSRESSYSSTVSCSTSASQELQVHTIHERRTLSSAQPPPSLAGFTALFHSRISTPLISPIAAQPPSSEEDREQWRRMLTMQREFKCYRSARLEAAVEAMDLGASFEDVPIPSKLCLDLIDEEMKAQIEARRSSI